MCVVCKDAADHYCLHTPDPICSVECKLAHFDDVTHEDASARSFPHRTVVAAMFSLMQHDASLLFRALCKLSAKQLPSPPDPVALASKTLSLGLLFSILDNPGPTFCNSDTFLQLVRDHLVMSLVQNSVFTVESVFRLSSSIFVALIAHFKPHLKTEIGIFLDNFFLRILSMPSSPFAHKRMAMQVISKLTQASRAPQRSAARADGGTGGRSRVRGTQDPQTILELFLNYDCDPASSNIFQGIVGQLEKVARGGFASRGLMTEEQVQPPRHRPRPSLRAR